MLFKHFLQWHINPTATSLNKAGQMKALLKLKTFHLKNYIVVLIASWREVWGGSEKINNRIPCNWWPFQEQQKEEVLHPRQQLQVLWTESVLTYVVVPYCCIQLALLVDIQNCRSRVLSCRNVTDICRSCHGLRVDSVHAVCGMREWARTSPCMMFCRKVCRVWGKSKNLWWKWCWWTQEEIPTYPWARGWCNWSIWRCYRSRISSWTSTAREDTIESHTESAGWNHGYSDDCHKCQEAHHQVIWHTGRKPEWRSCKYPLLRILIVRVKTRSCYCVLSQPSCGSPYIARLRPIFLLCTQPVQWWRSNRTHHCHRTACSASIYYSPSWGSRSHFQAKGFCSGNRGLWKARSVGSFTRCDCMNKAPVNRLLSF